MKIREVSALELYFGCDFSQYVLYYDRAGWRVTTDNSRVEILVSPTTANWLIGAIKRSTEICAMSNNLKNV